MTEDPEMLLEQDMGEAGRCIYGSSFMLELLGSCRPPEKEELASVTRELPSMLSPEEFAALFITPWFIFPEAERPSRDRADPDME